MSALLIASAEIMKLLLYYGICAGAILLVCIVMALLKYKTKKEMRASGVKKHCVKTRACAQEWLENDERAGILAPAKLAKLNGLVEELAWLAFQIFEEKKDLAFEKIAGALDGLATDLAKESANGYVTDEAYKNSLQATIRTLDGVIAKLDGIIAVK